MEERSGCTWNVWTTEFARHFLRAPWRPRGEGGDLRGRLHVQMVKERERVRVGRVRDTYMLDLQSL